MKTTEMTRTWIVVAALGLMMALAASLLAGCSNDSQQQQSASESQAASQSASESAQADQGDPQADEGLSEPAEMLMYVGADKARSASVIIDNELGADITFVSIIPTGSQDEPTSLGIEGGTWANGRMAAVFFDPAEDASSTYDMVFTAGGEFYDLQGADLTTNREVVLKANGTTAYLEPVQR